MRPKFREPGAHDESISNYVFEHERDDAGRADRLIHRVCDAIHGWDGNDRVPLATVVEVESESIHRAWQAATYVEDMVCVLAFAQPRAALLASARCLADLAVVVADGDRATHVARLVERRLVDPRDAEAASRANAARVAIGPVDTYSAQCERDVDFRCLELLRSTEHFLDHQDVDCDGLVHVLRETRVFDVDPRHAAPDGLWSVFRRRLREAAPRLDTAALRHRLVEQRT